METIAQPVALPEHHTRAIPAAVALVALGIVFGDIGTSPLYAFKQAAQAGGMLSAHTILGVASLILWTLVVVVSLKYAILMPDQPRRHRIEDLSYPAGRDRQTSALSRQPLPLDSRLRSGYALPASQTQRRFLIQIAAPFSP
jgi:K+ potassium transporter